MEPIVSPYDKDVDVLSEHLETLLDTKPASPTLRFVNFIVDGIVITIIFSLAQVAIAFVQSGSDGVAETAANNSQSFLLTFLLRILITCFYYVLFEGLSGGRTIGKFCTQTRVVKESGEGPISTKDAFLRTLCRLVPFEPFSAFGGYPWHDKWTHTKVIKITDPYRP